VKIRIAVTPVADPASARSQVDAAY